MKILKNLNLLFFSIIIVMSCSKDKDPDSIIEKSDAKQITSFAFLAADNQDLEEDITASINQDAKTISAELPSGTDIKALTPTLSISDKATVNPKDKTAVDFTNVVTYTVSAEDGSTQEYVATITTEAQIKSAAKEITQFTLSSVIGVDTSKLVGVINENEKTITLELPNGTNISSVKAVVLLSDKASISPDPLVARDYTNPVKFIVTAEDGSTQEYTVTITIKTSVEKAFITTWKTKTDNESITIPTFTGETYDYTIDWGDGTTNTNQTGNATHIYDTAGTYIVAITGDFPRIYFDGAKDNLKIQNIEQWGTQQWSSMLFAFDNCTYLEGNASDTPDLSNVTDMSFMFRGAENFNQNIEDWDLSNVTSTRGMFQGAKSFNGDISNWDVSKVTLMDNMFAGANNFNQDIGNWDVSNVTNMDGMFVEVTNFNQDISDWNVSKVKNMRSMFAFATSFNQDIGAWDVSNVTTMQFMFREAINFNKAISNWNVSKVTNMQSMFLKASSFNSSIGNWNVSNVTDMSGMFYEATNFNQNLNNWKVSKVTTMAFMFRGATNFNQPLNNWDVSKVTNMASMFQNVRLSSTNYDALLIGWEANGVLNNVSFSGGNSKFSTQTAKNARTRLIDNKGWTISDGGEE